MATYLAPGVAIDETTTASFTPILGEVTTLCLIGPSQGFQNVTEVTTLTDQTKYQLLTPFANVNTIRVVDASNPSTTVFESSLINPTTPDFSIDQSQIASGAISIQRSMSTRVKNASSVAVYFENQPAGTGLATTSFSTTTTLTGISQSATLGSLGATADLALSTVSLQNLGTVSSGDYTITGSSIVRSATASTLQRFQIIYVSYTYNSTTVVDQPFQLNYSAGANTAATPLNSGAAFPSTGTTNVIIKNAPGATGSAYAYTRGSVTDGDYILTGTGASATVARSAGTTSIGSSTNPDALQVIITYQATPINYCLPTRVFSTADAESKYGAAFDSNGNISSPLSFGAYLAFLSGAANVVLQPLFASAPGNPYEPPTGNISDWNNTLEQLKTLETINLIVPIYSSDGLTIGDASVAAVQAALSNFVITQNDVNERIDVLFGEDSTVGAYASMSTLRSHAASLASSSKFENLTLISPANFGFTNPITNTTLALGGQYAACSAAGWLASHPVQASMTRKTLPGLTGVNELRALRDKNADAASGLMVLENYNGGVRVRHAITVAQSLPNSSPAQQELNVVRAKHHIMDTIQATLDDQVVGNVPDDDNGPFLVQTLVTTTLDLLQRRGTLVAYGSVQVAASSTNAATVVVKFVYQPTYYINYIQVNFSLNTVTGATTITSNNLTTAF